MAKKKNNRIHISFVLDQTGSMFPVKKDTIGGFNNYLKNLKKERRGKPTDFTLTLFNTAETEIRHDSVPLSRVNKLTNRNYVPAAATPLYDAIGQTIRSLEKQNGNSKSLVVILTDGQENSSVEWNKQTIQQLIEEKQKDGWAFIYLGANQDAWASGGAIGIHMTNIMTYDISKTTNAFNAAAQGTAAYSRSGGSQTSSLMEDVNESDLRDSSSGSSH